MKLISDVVAAAKVKNQERRIHYLLEPGWKADAAVQGLGRSHRSAQVCEPMFKVMATDVQGEKRFISTIARRLDTLGALMTGGVPSIDKSSSLTYI